MEFITPLQRESSDEQSDVDDVICDVYLSSGGKEEEQTCEHSYISWPGIQDVSPLQNLVISVLRSNILLAFNVHQPLLLEYSMRFPGAASTDSSLGAHDKLV